MEDVTYIAFYKATGTWIDRLICWWTKGPFSHCELVVNGLSMTSSMRDGGVRGKRIDFSETSWTLIPVKWADTSFIQAYFMITLGEEYSVRSLILDQIINSQTTDEKASFCSEWCATALQIPSPCIYSPNTLHKLVTMLNSISDSSTASKVML